MVVGENQRRGVMGQRLPQDFLRMNVSAVGGPPEQLLKGNQPMMIVQVEDTEDLVGPVSQLSHEKPVRGVRRGQWGSQFQRLQQMAARQLQRRLKGSVAGYADALLVRPAFPLGRQQLSQGSKCND